MFKIAHTSDLGLKNWNYGGTDPETGLNKGFLDALKAFAHTITEGIERKVKYFIIAGDINEERNPEMLLVEKFSEQVQRLVQAGIQVIIVCGNHDLDGAVGTSTSVSYLKALKLPLVHVVDLKTEVLEFKDAVFHCLPYFTKNQLGHENNKELQQYLDNWLKKDKLVDGKINLLVSHYSVESSFYGLEIDEIRLKFELMKKYDYVALGHIHKYEMFFKQGVNGGYCGSPYIKDFGENFKKYFNILNNCNTEDMSIEKVEIPSREYVQIDIDALDAALSDVLEILKDNFTDKLEDTAVKVRIKTYQRFNPKPIYEFLRSQKVFHFVPVHWDVVQSDREMKLSVTSSTSDIDVVTQYLDNTKVDKSWIPKLKDLHQELMHEVSQGN